jgi:predicted RNase H-like HicB family nuclease
MRKDTERRDLKFYLNLSYPITIHPDPAGGYVAEIEELPGCMTQAETIDEAFKAIEDARQVWIQGTYEMGQDIPLPRDMEEYSGKFMVRIPRSLHRSLIRAAKREGVSLNQYVTTLLAAGLQKDIFLREPASTLLVLGTFGTEEKSYRYDEIISMERRELTKGRA